MILQPDDNSHSNPLVCPLGEQPAYAADRTFHNVPLGNKFSAGKSVFLLDSGRIRQGDTGQHYKPSTDFATCAVQQ